MFARYLVGIDGSAPSRRALGWALRRARRESAPLRLLYVAGTDFGAMGAEFEREDGRRGAALLSSTAAELTAAHPDVEVEERILSGGAAWELVRAVGAHDLLVVGTHKTGYLHGRVLGSRSVQIAAAAPSSVAVVPDVDVHLRRGVVAGIDRLATAASIARFAAHEAAALGDELTLIQALPLDTGPRTPARTRPLDEAVAAARAAEPTLQIRSRVVHRIPAEALLNAARDQALLVLGPGNPADGRAIIGSVLHDVLVNVNAPVLIARPADERELVGPTAERTAAARA